MVAFGLEISPRPDLPAIVARWQREITAQELKEGYFAVLATADEHGCWRWLLDLRRREELTSPKLADWLETDFFALLPQRYTAPVRMAFLVSPLRAIQAQTASSVATISSNQRPNQGYYTAIFTDEAAAYQWLAQ
ncbi:hypothetical protein [Hymenobacter sp. IS2118]|uniref:hypothetical protein n=1 Tax=Hymenobacter sp. IS2118 TaxID=1505605 RepID=UPI00054EC2AA|nr:hypothetical protein [Hymenobacter sp. IS2118]